MIKVVRDCPFCGNAIVSTQEPTKFTGIPRFDRDDKLIGFSTSCDVCGACGPVKPFQEQATLAWGLVEKEIK